ncbi:hypothetical protein Phi12:1_gp9 [Cellulophaga phage phi12:1]|uniref:Uncharacterized protein n=2 Tax=Cellulophaga phage phi12:1 TaxID=1327976 RepID=R9ZZK9_9CAUD|nr:hypothetical protein Phi12:1_gp9 [Cellulophaga phage phi12:1]AGO47975.1 hypothetical protein Phi12:1_gp9 [Cellulophaga phage phi12:1]AGO48140.1 hypothetical protein Phi12:3_gp9 [Cellulophaga phage phi12:3]
MSTDAFINEDYQAPSSGGFTKIEAGKTRLRILSSPLMVWVVWANGKSTRLPYDPQNKPALPEGDNPSVKHAWIMLVFNYNTNVMEIWELDKMTLITPLLNHSRDADWGHPKHYDIEVTKTGSGKDGTKYAMIAKPKTPVSDDVKEAYLSTPVDLSQLLVDGGNPFLPASGTAAPPADNGAAAEAAKIAAAKAAADLAAKTAAAQAAQATPAAGAGYPPF